jgi:hypothetical protein
LQLSLLSHLRQLVDELGPREFEVRHPQYWCRARQAGGQVYRQADLCRASSPALCASATAAIDTPGSACAHSLNANRLRELGDRRGELAAAKSKKGPTEVIEDVAMPAPTFVPLALPAPTAQGDVPHRAAARRHDRLDRAQLDQLGEAELRALAAALFERDAHEIGTEEGQSGSPVFNFTADQQRIVVAVHAYGGCPENRGIGITPGLHKAVSAWNAWAAGRSVGALHPADLALTPRAQAHRQRHRSTARTWTLQ